MPLYNPSRSHVIQVASYLLPTDTDDTNSIVRADSAASALGGGRVIFEPRTYDISSDLSVSDGVVWEGAAGKSILDFSSKSAYASGAFDGLVSIEGTGIAASYTLTDDLRAFGSGSALASVTRSSTTATATTTEDHGLTSGDYVWIIYNASGVSASDLQFLTQAASSEAHAWTVPVEVTVTGNKTFTYTVVAGDASPLSIATSCRVLLNALAAKMASTTGLSEGDLLWVTSDDTLSFTGGQSVKYGEHNRVARVVDSTTVVLAWPVRANYLVASSASLKKVSYIKGAGLKNLVISGKGPNNAAADGNGDCGIFMYNAELCSIEDVEVINCDQMAVKLLATIDCSVRRPKIRFPRSDESGLVSGYIDYQYGVAYGFSESLLIDAPNIEGGRHGVVESTTNSSPIVGMCRNVTLRDPNIRGCWSHCVSTHYVYEDVTVIGGHYQSKGGCINGRVGRMTIIGPSCRDSSTGIKLYGACRDITISGVRADRLNNAAISILPSDENIPTRNIIVSDTTANDVERVVYVFVDSGIPATQSLDISGVFGNNIKYEPVRVSFQSATPGRADVSRVRVLDYGMRSSAAAVYLSNVLAPSVTDIHAAKGAGSSSVVVNVDGSGSSGGNFYNVRTPDVAATLTVAATITGNRTDAFLHENLTIASGIIGLQFYTTKLVRLNSESAAATDDLDTINGGLTGQAIVFRDGDNNQDITFKDGTGNIQTESSADKTLLTSRQTISFAYTGSEWVQCSALIAN